MQNAPCNKQCFLKEVFDGFFPSPHPHLSFFLKAKFHSWIHDIFLPIQMWYSFSRNSVLFAPDKNLKIIHRTVVCFTRVKHLHITWVVMPFSGSVHGHTAFHTVHLVRLSGCKIQEINHGLIAPFPSTGRWQIAQSDNQITSVISCSSVWKIWKKLGKFFKKFLIKRLLYGDIYCLFNFKSFLF